MSAKSENKRLVSRRSFMRVAAIGTGAAALAACVAPPAAAPAPAAQSKPAEAKPTDAPAVASTGTTELIFWGHADHPIYDAGQAYMKLHPEVKFTQVELGDDRVQKVDATLAAGSGAPDLFWYEATDVQRLGRTGALLDVDEVVKKQDRKAHV